MKIGRNAPCPCGSGKKYKKCCEPLDRAAPRGSKPSGALSAFAAAEEWQVDVVPFPAAIENDPAARLGVRLVVAEDLALGHHEVLEGPSAETEELAVLLATGVETAGERTGRLPPRVRVRHPELVGPLARRLAAVLPDGEPPEVVAGPLPDLDELGFAFAASVGQPQRTHLSQPETWAAWDLPEELVASLFRAAAELYRAAPWTVLASFDLLRATTPAGRRWTVNVLGQAGEVFGLNLFSFDPDFSGMASGAHPFDDFTDRLIGLGFDSGQEVRRAMRREVAAAGWEVAAPDAYPRVFTLNSPAGGLPRRDAEDLLLVLGAVPRFLDHHAEAVEEGREVESWKDEASGLELSYDPSLAAPEPLELLPVRPGGAEGPGAEPEAALTEADRAREDPDAFGEAEGRYVMAFERHLAAEGLAEDVAEQHAADADLFVDFLSGYQGVPVRAVHEYDLRVFLFDWYPRKVLHAPELAHTLLDSLARFFAYLAAEEGIVCPWAGEMLAGEREAIAERLESVPGMFWWDEGMEEWRRDAGDGLFARVLIADLFAGDHEAPRAVMGMEEAALQRELERRWLLWREEEIRAGVDFPVDLFDKLVERQREWETTPRPDLDGRTPLEVIHAERRERRRGPKKQRPKKRRRKGRRR